ncbi:MAG: hypothetical protein ACOZNI_28590 [Myxococcota bacterium]
MDWLRWTWCLPQTLVSRVARAVVPGRRVERDGAVVVYTPWMARIGGVCLGDTILVGPDASDDLVAHEWGHYRQSLALGWLYYVVIGVPSVTHALWWRRFGGRQPHRYFHFYTEAWADAWGGVYERHAHVHPHWSRYAILPALLLLVPVLTWRAFGHALGFGFTDVDALADVAVAGRPLSEQWLAPLTGGYGKDNAAFWRPAAMLQFWAQRRLFGWEPAGWHAWDLAAHVVATWAFAAFASGTLRFAGHPRASLLSGVAACVFAVHPLAEEIVPAIARNIDLLLGIGFYGALAALVAAQAARRERRPAAGWTALYVAGVVLALGAKEAGVLVPVAAAAWILALRGDLDLRARIREAAAYTVPLAPLVGAYLAVRARVLGGLGGYYASEELLDHVGGGFGRGLVEPLLPSISRLLALGGGVPGGLAAVAIWAALLACLRPHARVAAALAGVYVPWIVLLDLTGAYTRRVVYVPTAALCLLVVLAGAEAWRRRHVAGLAAAAAVGIVWAWGSPAIRRYDDWGVSAAVAASLTDAAHWTDLPTGTTVYLVDRPSRVDVDPRRDRLWSSRRSLNNCVASYAIQAWADERFPGMKVRNLTIVVPEAPLDVATVEHDGDRVVVSRRPVPRSILTPKGALAREEDGHLVVEPDRARPAAILVWTGADAVRVWPWPAR